MKIFAGNSNLPLAKQVAALCGTHLSDAQVEKFSDGETRVELFDHVRGSQAFIIQSTCTPTNDNLMELLIMADALKRSDADQITAIIPYYGYARQDRRPDHTRTPITSRLVAEMIQASGIDHVALVDLHSGQQQGFFNIPIINLTAQPVFVADIWKNHYSANNNIVVVSPDTGGVVRARIIAKHLDDAELAVIDKRRPKHNQSTVMNVIGDVQGKTAIIIDDMIDTAGTLCKAAIALKDRGATKVIAYATHGVFSGSAFENIEGSAIDHVIVTDTIPIGICQPDIPIPSNIIILPIAHTIADTINRLASNGSVSEMYEGYSG